MTELAEVIVSQHIAVAVDVVVFAAGAATNAEKSALQVLLIKRGRPPYEGRWALPGGFLREDETAEAAAKRELREETGARSRWSEQLGTFTTKNRDPRGRVISIAYVAVAEYKPPTPGSDAFKAAWFPVNALPALVFDHAKILAAARERLKTKLEYTTAGFKMLPEKFTLTELREVYELVLGRPVEMRNFRRKVVEVLKVLTALPEYRIEGPGRPAQLYTFSEERLDNLRNKGIFFPF